VVLEHLFPEDWLERRGVYAFILGVVYAIVGVLIASVLFPKDPALVGVALTSLLLLPEMYKIFSIEERKQSLEQKTTFLSLWKDDIDLVRIYTFLFLGIILVYSVGTILLPSIQTNSLFKEQLAIRFGGEMSGNAIASGNSITGGLFDSALFIELLSNNLLVLIACFIMALLTGDGAIFLIIWNGSVWGTIFGITAKNAATFSGANVIYLFALVMLIVFPHMIIEGMSYFLAAIAGTVISKDVILEKFASDRFFRVFGLNLYLVVIALLFLILGAVVEAFVLDNVTIYSDIVRQSLLV